MMSLTINGSSFRYSDTATSSPWMPRGRAILLLLVLMLLDATSLAAAVPATALSPPPTNSMGLLTGPGSHAGRRVEGVRHEELFTKEIEALMRTDPESAAAVACFLCRQLMAASGQRVGLSQNQLQSALYTKCKSLPTELAADLQEHCSTFVETFLQEIYFSLNYDFSAKNVCVALNICDKDADLETKEEKEQKEREKLELEMKEKLQKEKEDKKKVEKEKKKQEKRNKKLKPTNSEEDMPNKDEKRLNCMFCDRMLDNAKQYAETAKADIESFASTACARWPRRRFSDECHRMADEKIAQLAKFVDEQVVEALWCGELYGCD